MTEEEKLERRKEQIKKRKKRVRNRRILFVVTETILLLVVIACAVLLHFLGKIGKNYVVVDEDVIYKPSQGTAPRTTEEVANIDPTTREPQTIITTDPNDPSESDVVVVIPSSEVVEAPTTTHPEFNPGTEYTTFCIIGVDGRSGYDLSSSKGLNSDVMMVATINNDTGEIRLASIYRDTLLKGYTSGKYDKANQPFSSNGYIDEINTLAYNLDIAFDYFVVIDWTAAIEIIQLLGGVDVEMKAAYKTIKNPDPDTAAEQPRVPYFNGLINEIVESTGIGTVPIPDEAFQDGLIYHLDGVQAVAYMRMRRTDSDFNRTQRQRDVMGQALELAKKADLGTLVSMLDIVGNNMLFNISQDSIIGLMANATKYSMAGSYGYPSKLYDGSGYEGKMKWNVIPVNVIQNVTALHLQLYPDLPYYPSDVIYQIDEELRLIGQFDENWELHL
ncbi:MAG: LCP family protein [Lachnospiraceae bacterium]|nr:LCP family protein [Lachnospiraceae bacterium]